MKKRLMAIASLLVVLCFASCGKKTPNELLENSTRLDWGELTETVNKNPARAEQDYEGKWYNFEGTVIEISTDYCVISDDINSAAAVEMTLSISNKDDLASLNFGDILQVVGKLNSISEKKLTDVSIVKRTPMEENVEYLTKYFLYGDGCAEALLSKIDTFTKLDGAKINEIFSASYTKNFYEKYYSIKDGAYSSTGSYENTLITREGGTGYFQELGKENVIWCVEGNNLYFKTSNEKDSQLKTDDYKFDVYRIDDDGWNGRSKLCVGKGKAFIIR